MTATTCPFCEIAAGRAPATLLATWSDAIAITPLRPVVPGHILIIPKVHVADFAEDPDVSASVMRRASEVTRGGPPSNVITSIGAEATQTVFHLHVHVVPRRAGDSISLPWDVRWATPGERLGVATDTGPAMARLAGLREQARRADLAAALDPTGDTPTYTATQEG